MFQVPTKYVKELNNELCQLLTLCHMDIKIVMIDMDSGIFSYYYKDDVEKQAIANIVNAQKNNIEVDENFKYSLDGCANYEKQEFNGGTYKILNDFEERLLNNIMFIELLAEQQRDIQAGVTIFSQENVIIKT